MIPRSKACNVRTPKTNHKDYVLREHYHLIAIFFKDGAEELPPYRPDVDYGIPIQEGKTTPFGLLYNLNLKELITLKEHLQQNLRKGFIQASKSLAGAPVLFVPKSEGTL